MLNDKFLDRFGELHNKSATMPTVTSKYGTNWIERYDWFSWATDCQILIRAVFGETSPYYENFVHEMDSCTGSLNNVESMKRMFVSAKGAFEGGYVFDTERSISGEVIGDFVALAKQALAEGHKDVAAVLASAALEDVLKRYAKLNGLDVEDKDMKQVISALKSKSLVAGFRTKMLDVLPTFRNYALHANWEKITEPEVNSMIGFVESFLLKEFSS